MTLTTSIMVRDHNNPSVVATTGSFTVAPAPAETMTVRTPIGIVVGSAVVLSGTYANGTPAAIDYSTDAGATWFALGSPAIAGGSWSGSGPTYSAANPAATIMVRDHGNTGVTATTAAFAVTAAPAGAGLFRQQFTYKNPEDKAAQISPFFTHGMGFASGELPATGTKMVLADATGTNVIGEVQVDQKANGWLDGSTNIAALSGNLTGSTLNPGDIAGPLTIMAVAGTPNTTPCYTLAQLAARTDIKLVCKIGVDTYTVSLNTIISKYNYGTTRPNYPVGFIEQWKSGPVICEDMLAQYLIRDSDGAQHRWLILRVYPSRLANGNIYLMIELENANSYGPHPAGTIGPTGLAGTLTVDSIDIYNATTLVGAGGGPNDPRAGTFLPAAVNVATASITCQMAGTSIANGWSGPFFSSIGFSSTGKLPGSVGSETYWVWNDASKNLVPFISRNWLARVDRGNVKKIAALTAGLAVTTAQYVIANGAYYACTTAGTSSGALPTGATFTDGTLVWTRISAPLSDQGTGTHKVFPKVSVNQYSKAPIAGTDTYPLWIGSGQMPQLMPGFPIQYLTQKSKAVPPLKMDVNPKPWVGPIPNYWWNTSYMPGQTNYYYIGDVGSSGADERINTWSAIAGASLFLPNDIGIQRSMRYVALSFMDRIYFPRDERMQQQLVANYGPDRLGGTYPGMAPCNTAAQFNGSQGSPKMIGIAADKMNWPGYGGDLGSVQSWDSSHSPNPLYWAYLHSGHPIFLDAMMEYCNSQFLQSGGPGSQGIRSVKMADGKTYSWACNFGHQARGFGHQIQTTWPTEWSIPSNHPAKAYFSDRMDDTSNQCMNWLKATFSPTAIANGWIPTVYNTKSWPQAALEPWMQGFVAHNLGHIAWINTRPGFHDLLDHVAKSWLKLYDTDHGGSEKFLDAQWYWVATTLIGASATTVPNDADFISDGHIALADCFSADPTKNPLLLAWPPPANNFCNGLQTQGQQKYVYYTTPIPPNNYMPMNRAAIVMGTVAGHPQFAKVLARIDALLASSGVPVGYVLATGTGNLNGYMYAVDAF